MKASAVLLAAGRSRRMGSFKPLLPFGGRMVVEACVESLRAGGACEVVVVLGHRGDEVRAALGRRPFVRFAVNAEAQSEMGVSIARGVEALNVETEAVLVALVDQPAVPPEAVREILEARRRTGARLIIPTWEGRGGHPVLLDLSLRGELLTLAPERGLRAVFESRPGEVLRLPSLSPYVARDMDTWDDYRALHLEIFGSAPPDPDEMNEAAAEM
jgi:molybdenum cofactor cytidylyltransferase